MTGEKRQRDREAGETVSYCYRQCCCWICAVGRRRGGESNKSRSCCFSRLFTSIASQSCCFCQCSNSSSSSSAAAAAVVAVAVQKGSGDLMLRETPGDKRRLRGAPTPPGPFLRGLGPPQNQSVGPRLHAGVSAVSFQQQTSKLCFLGAPSFGPLLGSPRRRQLCSWLGLRPRVFFPLGAPPEYR